MKKETIKEMGKFFLDLAKIVFAIAILTPLVTNDKFEIAPVAIGIVIVIAGIYLTNKGAKDE